MVYGEIKFHLSGQSGAEERDWELVSIVCMGLDTGSFLMVVGSTKVESLSESLEWMLVTSVLQSEEIIG